MNYEIKTLLLYIIGINNNINTFSFKSVYTVGSNIINTLMQLLLIYVYLFILFIIQYNNCCTVKAH